MVRMMLSRIRGDNGEEAGDVLPLVAEVAGQASQPGQEPPAQQKKQADQGDSAPDNQQKPAQILKVEHIQ